MVKSLISKGKEIFTSQQTSILSAASVITAMIILSQIFGLIRQWTILKFLGKETFSLYIAAFRLPDLVFEVFAYGAFSSAFIPVFSKYLKKNKREAWDIASRVINIGLIIFFVLALIFGLFSYQFYSFVAFGFNETQTLLVSNVARVIFLAQGLFIISYVITGVLESSKRFLVPALAPLFYNIGIIVGTIFFSETLGIFAPTIGVVIGALMHLLVQLPLARKLGFRFSSNLRFNEGVRQIGRLSAPRFIELASLQVQKSAELFFASIISIAAYGYLNLAVSIQSIPVMLFGVSLSKAALVSLSHEENMAEFRRIFLTTLNQMMFLVVPISAFLVVLRIPVVRLTYGTSHSLDWNDTVQIGLTLSSFAIGVPLQAALALISRAFYARHDTKTPVVLSIIDVFLTVVLEVIFVLVMKLPVWSLALANTLAAFVQVSSLYIFLSKKIGDGRFLSIIPTLKSFSFALVSSAVMFITLKLFDRSVWVKKLSFLGKIEVSEYFPFEKFVLDTRYTVNLLALTILVLIAGATIYLTLSFIFRSEELWTFLSLIKRIFRRKVAPIPAKEEEPVAPNPTDIGT